MKIAEIKNIETKELVEKLESAVDALNKKKLNHNITPLENPSEINYLCRIIICRCIIMITITRIKI